MKNSKIAKYLHKALGQDDAKRKDALIDILAKMKKKDRKLKDKLAEAKNDKERDEITNKIKVNRAHRRKGIKAYRELMGKEGPLDT
ncbi:hypothetical protein [Magnetovibrio blakemorei]|uniref:Uncharacterized protein n=1 Tax=Magnetovibrio blakemorei TaxID=28181 RepID=A0A1E5Q5Z6_9PROT|nr:hypothetical protein [Magnetovibrio blakemorei]OEJ65904.1 hypothetical protein BEN30_13495 [Magnetovibrio blakemorei]